MNDQQQSADPLARAVHWTLLIGLIGSGLLMIVGLFMAMLKNQPRPMLLITSLSDLLRMAGAGNGVAWMELGILLLLLTPIMRVIVLAIGWAVRRDGRMALVALTVLALLAISMWIGVG
jgi:uncharacterized membrane protein